MFSELPIDTYYPIVQEVLPIIVKLNVYIPFFKYQKITNNLNSDNSIKSHYGKSDTLRNCQNISIDDYRVESNRERTLRIVKKFDNILEMINSESVSHCIQWIPYLDQDKIDTKILREFLINQWPKYGAQDTTYSSAYKKCICLLDYLENANH
ncbi:MAG: hypothetical protein IPO37_13255 [Saprospiraceae bacterium]|nr:hypothetical protein [Saprospiraceae bacterium]